MILCRHIYLESSNSSHISSWWLCTVYSLLRADISQFYMFSFQNETKLFSIIWTVFNFQKKSFMQKYLLREFELFPHFIVVVKYSILIAESRYFSALYVLFLTRNHFFQLFGHNQFPKNGRRTGFLSYSLYLRKTKMFLKEDLHKCMSSPRPITISVVLISILLPASEADMVSANTQSSAYCKCQL